MAWGGSPTGEFDRWVKTTPSNPVVLTSGIVWEGGAVSEPSVLSPSLSPDSTNWWMWYRGGWSTTGIGVATSPDGRTWTKNVGNPIFQPNTSVVEFHVFPQGAIGGSYYAIFNKGAGTTTCFRYATSSDGITWTDGGQALASTSGNWWYRSGTPVGGNTNVYYDGSTYHLFFEAQDSSGNWQVGRATSSNPQGPYTESFGNPITSIQPPGLANPQASNPFVVKINNNFHMWYHSQPNLISGKVWSQIYRAVSPAIQGPWYIYNGGNIPVVGITESGSGLSTQDQTADPCLVESSGASYMWYDIDDNTNSTAKICLATYPGTLANIVLPVTVLPTFTPTYVQSNAAPSNSVTLTGVQHGNVLVVAAGDFGDTNNPTTWTATDASGNTYSRLTASVGGSNSMAIFATAVGTGGSITVTVSGQSIGSTIKEIIVAEYTGCTNSAETVANNGSGFTGNTGTVPSLTTAGSADALIYAGYTNNASGGPAITYSPADITNRIISSPGNGSQAIFLADRYPLVAGTYGGETITVSTNAGTVTMCAAALVVR